MSSQFPAGYSPGVTAVSWPVGGQRNLPVAGGTITRSGKWVIHTFTSSGTLIVKRPVNIEFIVVAGGGAGRFNRGGGGAGGYRSSVSGEASGGGASAESTIMLPPNHYTMVVGAGGSVSAGTSSTAFLNTQFSVSTVGGGLAPDYNNMNGNSGGSGSGVGFRIVAGISIGGAGTSGQGYKGGDSLDNSGGLTGGGGAGGAGVTGDQTAGGVGVISTITGFPVTYAIGGHGSNNHDPIQNSGNGGSGNAINVAKTGSSGIIIVRYRVT